MGALLLMAAVWGGGRVARPGSWLLLLWAGWAVIPCGAAPRPPWTTGNVVGSPNPPAPYRTEAIYPGRRFPGAVDLALMPGGERWVAADNGGKMWSFRVDDRAASRKSDDFFDMRESVRGSDNLLGFAFHPGFRTNRYVYININEPGNRPRGSKVSRFRVTATEPPVVDPTTETVIIDWASGGHNGCTVAFGPDGTMFISTG
ncbi:MAG: PQQ-dependent sugar dehydrogenase, partial [Verrucomicrobiales bacterium]|nr:PQQ-dependent sugar dehydrogenase [Verrucomicrobiales bacterium]